MLHSFSGSGWRLTPPPLLILRRGLRSNRRVLGRSGPVRGLLLLSRDKKKLLLPLGGYLLRKRGDRLSRLLLDLIFSEDSWLGGAGFRVEYGNGLLVDGCLLLQGTFIGLFLINPLLEMRRSSG